MPSGSNAPLPTASLCAGTPNRITAFTPSAASSVDLLAQALAGVLHDAGQRRDRQRVVDALADEQRGDEVAGAHGRSRRRGRAAPGSRAAAAAGRSGTSLPIVRARRVDRWAHDGRPVSPIGRTDAAATAATTSSSDGERRRRRLERRARGGAAAVRRTDRDDDARSTSARAVGGHASTAEPLASTTASAAASTAELVGASAARSAVPVGLDDVDVVAERAQPVGERRRRGRPGRRARGPAPAGNSASSRPPLAAPARGRRGGRRRRPSAAAVAAPTAASRSRGRPAAAPPTASAPLAEVTTSQSNAIEAGRARRAAPPRRRSAARWRSAGRARPARPSVARGGGRAAPGVWPRHHDRDGRRAARAPRHARRPAARRAARHRRGEPPSAASSVSTAEHR